MDQQDQRRAHTVDGDTGQQQAGRGELSVAGRGAHHDEQNQTRAGERPGPDAGDACHHVPIERDGDHSAKRRAGRDPSV